MCATARSPSGRKAVYERNSRTVRTPNRTVIARNSHAKTPSPNGAAMPSRTICALPWDEGACSSCKGALSESASRKSQAQPRVSNNSIQGVIELLCRAMSGAGRIAASLRRRHRAHSRRRKVRSGPDAASSALLRDVAVIVEMEDFPAVIDPLPKLGKDHTWIAAARSRNLADAVHRHEIFTQAAEFQVLIYCMAARRKPSSRNDRPGNTVQLGRATLDPRVTRDKKSLSSSWAKRSTSPAR